MAPPLAIVLAFLRASFTGAAPAALPAAMPEPLPNAARQAVEEPLPQTPPSRAGIGLENGPTMRKLGSCAGITDRQALQECFDGSGSTAAPPPVGSGTAVGPIIGKNPIAARLPIPPVPNVSLGVPRGKGAPFWDDHTVGFAALGAAAGGLLGVGLVGLLGLAGGPLLGAFLGLALLVGLWKWKGYKKDDKK